MKRKILSCFIFVMILSMCVGVAFASDIEEGVNDVHFSDWGSSNGVLVSDVMTYEEMIERYARIEGISVSEADSIFGNLEESDRGSHHGIVFSIPINVTSNYIPMIDCYCDTVDGGHFFNITNIYAVQLNRNYQGLIKQFNGDIQCFLNGSTTIEYIINGDFYNLGTTIIQSTIGLTDGIEVSYTCGTSSNHFAYVYKHGYKTFA